MLWTFMLGIFFCFPIPEAGAAKVRPKGEITGRVIDDKGRPIAGVINLITKPISEKPEFYFQTYGGLYEKPYYNDRRWSDRARFLHGFKANYAQKIKGFGFRVAATRNMDDSYRRNDYKSRYNINAKWQYDITAYDQITVSANYMEQIRGNFLNWLDINNALLPPADQLSFGLITR